MEKNKILDKYNFFDFGLLLKLILFCQISTFGQQGNITRLYFQHIQEGLSQNRVTCIKQDSQGYIWAGTVNGLNRYDGVSFDIFKNIPNDNRSLPNNKVEDIFEDSNKDLWIATSGGLARFDRNSQEFEVWNTNSSIPLSSSNILAIWEDSKNNLWIGTNAGLNKLSPERTAISVFPGTEKFSINAGLSDVNDNIWIGTDSGVYIKSASKTAFSPFSDSKNKKIDAHITTISDGASGEIWIGTENEGLYQLLPEGEDKFTSKLFMYDAENPYSLGNNNVLALSIDSKNRLWVGTDQGGLNLFDRDKHIFIRYNRENSDRSNIKSNVIYDISEDRQGRLWISTYNQGIELYDPLYKKFKHILQGISGNSVTSFTQEGEKLWIGTDGGGITIWNREANSFSTLQKRNEESGLNSNAILDFLKTDEATLWIATWAGGLNKYQLNTHEIKTYMRGNSLSDNEISGNNLLAIDKDSKGNIWLAVFGEGICKFNPKTEKFTSYGANAGLKNTQVLSLFIDNKDRIWVGTRDGGLYGVNLNEDGTLALDEFLHHEGDTFSLSNNTVNTIFQDSKNSLWVGTKNGLSKLSADNKTFTSFNVEDGLPNESIKAIIEDKHGDLWISTNKGLCRLESDEKDKITFTSYDITDGLQSNEFLRNSAFINESGEIFLGGINGFNTFNPSEVYNNPNPPQLVFTDLKISNKSVAIGKNDSQLKMHINETQRLILNHTQSIFSIEFRALNFTHPDRNEYAYKLEGFEDEWNFVGNRSLATYTNLDPGVYIFRVKACNNDGVWNNEGTSLEIEILPPWWQTWWARTALLLMIIGIALSYYRYKTYKLKKNQELLQKLVEERTVEVQKQSQELQQRAIEINVQNEELQQQAEELVVQRDNLHEANQVITLKNEMITDSINYAKRIQEAILPSRQELQEALGDHFVMFMPKDIVSGDFYWMLQSKEYTFIAVVDCTGHGVPGACMSMMGSSLLNRIVGEMHIHDPAKVLMKLDSLVVSSLRQNESDNKDGMDIALCRIKKLEGKTEVAYAGAKNGLFYYDVEDEEILKIKGNRFSIGGISSRRLKSIKAFEVSSKDALTITNDKTKNNRKSFDTHKFNLQEGSVLYLTTDGLIDQNDFNRKRWGSKRLKEVLSSCGKLPVWKQKLLIENQLESFKQHEAQRDDIAFIGVKI